MIGEGVQEPPEWQERIGDFLRIVENRGVRALPEAALSLVHEMLTNGQLSDLATLERHLAGQDACLRLVAVDMQGEFAPPPGFMSIDPRDNTEKSHGLMAIVHPDREQVGAYFAQLAPDPEQNLQLLQDHTGLVALPDAEMKAPPANLEEAIADLEAKLNFMNDRGVDPSIILQLTVQTVSDLVRRGIAPDLGTIQEYLRHKPGAIFELTYRPIAHAGIEGARALDLVTGEERPNYFIASFGDHRLRIVDHETNVHRLRHETGMATI